jgi:hypothetical protein
MRIPNQNYFDHFQGYVFQHVAHQVSSPTENSEVVPCHIKEIPDSSKEHYRAAGFTAPTSRRKTAEHREDQANCG